MAGCVAAVLAIALPGGWYDALPRLADAPPRPFSGMLLLRATLAVEAVAALLLAITGWKPRNAGPSRTRKRDPADDHRHTAAITAGLLGAITLLGGALRAYRLGLDLWLDEIATVTTYASPPLAAVYGSYLSPGNHLLNSVLLKISVIAFGETEWAVRLPAALLGTATIPVMYWVARKAMSRAASMGAALLLAVSYHHIFFSQNARGYSGHLLFALVSIALLASALEEDESRSWLAYPVAMMLAFTALMTNAFQLVAHAMVGGVEAVRRIRAGVDGGARALALRLVLALGAAGFLAFQVYAVAIPDVLAIYPTVYATQGSGFVIFSMEFIGEMVRGVSAGFLSAFAAIPVVIIGAAGFLTLLRRNWIVASALALSLVVTVAFLILRGQSIAPRFLLPGLPLVILSIMATVDAVAAWVARRQEARSQAARNITVAAVAVLSLGSLFALPSYYSAAKQPYRAAIAHLQATWRPGDKIAVAYPAGGGIRYYLARQRIPEDSTYFFIRTPAELDSVLAGNPGARVRIVTTLFRVLRTESDELATKLEAEWSPVTSFRGTLGDGDIRIWERRISGASAEAGHSGVHFVH